METESYISIKQAAIVMSVTKQAIYVALAKKKLKAQKIGRNYRIYPKDLEEYERNKYRRMNADKKENEISIPQAAEILNVTHQVLYYAAKTRKIKFRKSGCKWFLDKESLINHFNKKFSPDRLSALFEK